MTDTASFPFIVIIPARYGSTRFPGKPLAMIQNKPMIQHVVERAIEAKADKVIVATDDQRIADAAMGFGANVCMTRSDHQSGTERLAEVVEKEGLAPESIVVNVQGDEPFIPAANIRQVAQNLSTRAQCAMATLATPITELDDLQNPNVVKVVADRFGHAMYFSRASIPFDRDGIVEAHKGLFMRHIGIYAYRASYIQQYVDYPASALEKIESLEQLRALWNNDKIHIELAKEPPPTGIDTPDDLARLNQQLTKGA
ncbi:3-deoxy-manno-octulosonate cytidylyltransferase [Alteromonas facilis]|uniref:3-deoxy-manno-octulosonate cytidylyltransferase n=1 Tax=Alteromonas facilis TaxID=2048004 RepID=UPI000C28D8A3|nr:3-deoxy-manno-octulosonate cytidylyltransferase [Alteromonas facilis]